MKYAFFILASLILLSSHSAYSQDRAITSFKDSEALLTIAEFMRENAEDLKVSFRISDKKLKVLKTDACISVTGQAVIKDVQSAVNTFLRLFPDEELPLEEAFSDLSVYLGNSRLKKCDVSRTDNQKQVQTAYYYDESDKIHIKVDTITLLSL